MNGWPDSEPTVSVQHGARRVLLKWHKLRQAADEPPFDPANLRAGLAAGASLEIDIRCLGDGTWVCLHDDRLDEETTGTGPVTALDRPALAGLRIAGADYSPPLLDDVAQLVREAGGTGARLQLDLKEPAAGLSADRVAGLAAALHGIEHLCLVSGYHWPVLARLGAAIPGVALGYDPYEAAQGRALETAADFDSFARETLAIAPQASMFYLYHRFVAAALDHGVNPVAILQSDGAAVDVWTLDPSMPDFRTVFTRMVEAGADQITTNAPRAAARLSATW